MNLKGKKILVVGLGRSGISASKLLDKLGASVIVNDSKAEEQIKPIVQELKKDTNCSFILGREPDELIGAVDLIVLSPGVPTDSQFLIQARKDDIEVISEIELAYRLCKAPIIAITGTNGKTTTTALLGEIFKAANKKTFVVGNIGIPFTEIVTQILPSDIVILEVSSFQLESIKKFKPAISVILNLTEDHINRHKTMENYINAKLRIFENQDKNDFVILNADDDILSSIDINTEAKIFYFSRHKVLDSGAWVENGKIMADIGKDTKEICHVGDIAMPGVHNLENALAAILSAVIMGLESSTISKALYEFPGVEHRIEKVETINGVTFYNDSKGTNPDAAIKAIDAMKGSTILIAGGMDKKSDMTVLIKAFKDKVKSLVVLGETADIITQAALSNGFTDIHRVKTIEEAVEKSFALSSPGDNVLLSPACASWDMFKDYEERGRVFKGAVRALRR